jgi:hypothetical protein
MTPDGMSDLRKHAPSHTAARDNGCTLRDHEGRGWSELALPTCWASGRASVQFVVSTDAIIVRAYGSGAVASMAIQRIASPF